MHLYGKSFKTKEVNPDLIISHSLQKNKRYFRFFIKEFDYKGEIIFEESIYEAPYINIFKSYKKYRW